MRVWGGGWRAADGGGGGAGATADGSDGPQQFARHTPGRHTGRGANTADSGRRPTRRWGGGLPKGPPLRRTTTHHRRRAPSAPGGAGATHDGARLTHREVAGQSKAEKNTCARTLHVYLPPEMDM